MDVGNGNITDNVGALRRAEKASPSKDITAESYLYGLTGKSAGEKLRGGKPHHSVVRLLYLSS